MLASIVCLFNCLESLKNTSVPPNFHLKPDQYIVLHAMSGRLLDGGMQNIFLPGKYSAFFGSNNFCKKLNFFILNTIVQLLKLSALG